MRINNIGYLLKEGIRGIFLHGFMSFAAICVTVACLVIVGSFSILAYNLDIMVEELNQTSEILVYVDSELSDAEARSIGTKINTLDNILQSTFISREEALEEFLAENEEAAAYLDITASDFSHSYCVTVNREIAERIAAQLETIPGIDRTHTDIWTPETIYFLAPEDSYEKLIAAMALLPQSNSSSEH